MRSEPERLRFEIVARDGDARAGILHTPHGPIETPCFVPARDPGIGQGPAAGRGLGDGLRDGPRQHLPPDAVAGRGADRRVRRPPRLHGLGSADNHRFGRFPGVFSGSRQRRRRGEGPPRHGRRWRAACSRSARRASGSAPTSTAPSSSSRRSARWRSRARSAPTSRSSSTSARPFHADRDYTARSTERTHRWLDRCLAWHGEHGAGRSGRLRDRPGRDARGPAAASRRTAIAAAGVDGIAIGGTLGEDKEQMREVVGMTVGMLPGRCAQAPARDRRGGRSRRGRRRSVSTASTARSRPGSAGTAWRWPRCPSGASATTSARAATATRPGPLVVGCPCVACTRHSRGYVHYLSKAEELTGVRLLTIHNLTYTARADARRPRRDRRRRLRRPTGTRSSPAPAPGRPAS